MFAIYHNIEIGCSSAEVFKCFVNREQLSQWWAPVIQFSDALNGLNVIGVEDVWSVRLRNVEIAVGQSLRWRCENQSDPDWSETEIHFRLETSSKGCVLHFEHSGWKEQSHMYGLCSYQWARHLSLLKDLCETGRSSLSPKDELQLVKDTLRRDDGVINLAQKLSLFSDHWSPKIMAELNGQQVKLAKLKGEFVWHSHEDEDELFLVLQGALKILFRDKTVTLHPGEAYVVPRGVEHKPVAEFEVSVMLFEPATTLNTGNAITDLTQKELKRI